MKYSHYFILLAVVLGACSTAKTQTSTLTSPAPTMSSATALPNTPTSSLEPIVNLKPTFTLTPTEEPFASGTPLANFNTVPIPTDAIWGMETAERYIFASQQSPTDISNYYQQILPQHGWEVQDVSADCKLDKKHVDEICMSISQVEGKLQGVFYIFKKIDNELAYVWITIFITD